MDIILRNLQRLVFSNDYHGKETVEPMSEWKWNKLYEFAISYGLGPWVADGFRRYADDFFLQPSDELRAQFLALDGEKNQEVIDKFRLHLLRSERFVNRFSRASLEAYFHDFMHTVRNIEE
jgi:hypothetical protein